MVNSNKKKRKNNRNKKNKLHKAKDSGQIDDQEQQHELETPEDEVNESTTTKRHHDDDDSDTEDKPQKKKKKKQPMSTDTDKKGKKSIRQMKREKYAQRQAETQAVAKDQLKGQCLNYLSQWKHDRQNWKFMKAKQVWLYKNKFVSHLIPDASWPLLLEYFESAVGNIRNMLLEDAKKVIKQMDEWTESQNGNNEDEDENNETPLESKKPNDTTYKRARDLIQCLQE